jgi:DNA-binding LytR/AlgR family response regulator
MLKIIIIEDEKPVYDHLVKILHNIAPDAEIIAHITTVAQGIDYMSRSPQADLILSDIQLSDGLAFEIFSHSNSFTPVIFITGYDSFMLTAFNHNAIDYVLKPVTAKELSAALDKYKLLKQHFIDSSNKFDNLLKYLNGHKKTRLLVRKGLENMILKLDDIVLLYTENKIVYVIDKNGKKYIADKNLSDLEEELDDTLFFRANRQYILNLNYIKGYKPYEKVKLMVNLSIPELNYVIIVSQETASDFRKWMYEA